MKGSLFLKLICIPGKGFTWKKFDLILGTENDTGSIELSNTRKALANSTDLELML